MSAVVIVTFFFYLTVLAGCNPLVIRSQNGGLPSILKFITKASPKASVQWY